MPETDYEALRPRPEQILKAIQRESRKDGRGRLKLFVGFAAGVGKTYEMLAEANRRNHESGQDVVIGFVETHGRKDTQEQIGDLEIIPRKKIEYRGTMFDELDTDAVIARRPEWVLVDELAHTNIPGSKNEKRYQDVLEILDAGINVASTLNIQHLESLNDTILEIANVRVRETVPDWVVEKADEIVTVDISPRALINRIERGDVYPKEQIPQALEHFFTPANLSALREIALREVASTVDRSLQEYREDRNILEPWRTQERIMVCMSPHRSSAPLLRRGWRVARRLMGDIVGVYVPPAKLTIEQQQTLESDFLFAERLGIRIDRVDGPDVAGALAHYAHSHGVTQVVVGHSEQTRWQELVHGSFLNRLIRLMRGIDVLVVASESPRRNSS